MVEYKLITDFPSAKEGEIRMKKYKCKGKQRTEFFILIDGKWKYYPVPEEYRKPPGGASPVGTIKEDYRDGKLSRIRQKQEDGSWKTIERGRKGVNALPEGTIRYRGNKTIQKQGNEWVVIHRKLPKHAYPEGSVRVKNWNNRKCITQKKENGKWVTVYKDKSEYIIPPNTPIGKYGPRPELRNLIYGIGENDVMIPEFTNTRTWRTWVGIIRRTDYRDPKWMKYHPSYEGCTLDPRWYKLSEFKKWIEQWEDYQNKEVDKDILIPGNKIYGPDTCLMVRPIVNSWFMPTNLENNGELPVGVSWNPSWKKNKSPNPYKTQISLIGKKRIYLGVYATIEEASASYEKVRKEQIQILIETETDPRVIKAMLDHEFK
jgi:hypothetical protein